MAAPKLTSHIQMSCEDWIAVPSNPIQRDTERHAQRAKHLLVPLPVHAVVAAARLPSGKLVKLDGHTRALIWDRLIVPRPAQIEVHLYEVPDLEEAARLYKTFDSKEAMETSTDKVSGALRGMGYTPQSGQIASGAINSALRISWQAVYGFSHRDQARDVYEAINEFAAEIIALDEMGLAKGQLRTGVMAAVFISFRKHGDPVMGFWRAVANDSGTKNAGVMDAVQGLKEVMLSRPTNAGHNASNDLCARALTCVEAWHRGENFHRLPRPTDIGSYLENPTDQRPKYKLVHKGKVKKNGKMVGSLHAQA